MSGPLLHSVTLEDVGKKFARLKLDCMCHGYHMMPEGFVYLGSQWTVNDSKTLVDPWKMVGWNVHGYAEIYVLLQRTVGPSQGTKVHI